jgi:diguanylate cyclase (GGDEF)-like protein
MATRTNKQTELADLGKTMPSRSSLSASRILAGTALATLGCQTLLAYIAPGAAAEAVSAGPQIAALISRPELSLAAVAALAFAFTRIDYKGREAPLIGQSRRQPTWANDGNVTTELSYSDSLTGMANRRRFMAKLNNLYKHRQTSKGPFAVGLIDLDGFKQINGIYGHAAGDDVVRQVALRLEGFAGSHGFMARFSGGQFAFLSPDVSSEEEAAELGSLLSEVVNAPYDVDGRKVRISSSFGFALFPDFAETP